MNLIIILTFLLTRELTLLNKWDPTCYAIMINCHLFKKFKLLRNNKFNLLLYWHGWIVLLSLEFNNINYIRIIFLENQMLLDLWSKESSHENKLYFFWRWTYNFAWEEEKRKLRPYWWRRSSCEDCHTWNEPMSYM